MKKLFAIVFLVLLGHVVTYATGSAKDSANVNIIKAETEIHSWFSTGNGVWCVNKRNNHVFKLTTQNSILPSDSINDICAAKDGNVYIATNHGILKYDGYAYTLINAENSKVPSAKITAIKEDINGDLWIGTDYSWLIRMRNYNCKFYTSVNSPITTNGVKAIKADDFGNLLIVLANSDKMVVTNGNFYLIKPDAEPSDIIANN